MKINKFFAMILTAVLLVGTFSTQVYASPYLPEGYTDVIGGKGVNFSGTAITFTFTTNRASNGVMLESRVYDSSTPGSMWSVEIKKPKAADFEFVANITTSASEYPEYDYEWFKSAPQGTYTVRIKNIANTTSSSTNKYASFFIWALP